jgi:hypothetical protein
MANSNGMQVRIRGDQFSQRELNYINLQDTQRIPAQCRKRQPRRRKLLIGVLLFLCLASTISPVVGYLIYHTYDTRYRIDLSLAQTGTQHLQKAESLLATWSKRPLDTKIPNQAQIEFAAAFKHFEQLNNDLAALPGFIKQVPEYGARLNSALRLVSLAMTLSQAGVTGCSILNTLETGLRDPWNPQSHGITQTDLTVVNQDVKKLENAFALVAQQINQLQPGAMQFDSRIPKLVNTFHKEMPKIQGWIDTMQNLLPVAPALLGIGAPTNYLIEVLDSTELRPAGGLIGNYGIATFSGGRLSAAHITDVDLLDGPFELAGHVIPYPAAYTWFDLAPGSWSFRDSNLDADFPTAAYYGEQTYRKEGGNVPVQGVIALTPALIEHALEITGPIAVPEYRETVTAQNLIARLHFHQQRFIELLAEHFLARVHQLSSVDLSKFFLLMVDAVHSKDLQLYFNSSIAEDVLHQYHLDAAIQAPVGDSFFVVDANISPNIANDYIITSMHDQVTIDSQGNVMHRATLRYAWTIAGKNYGSSLYRDYVHVYVPPGSILLAQGGWQPRGTSDAFKREVWMGYFELSYRHTQTITLVWKVPAAASKNQSGWHYHYLVQRQAGALWKLNLQIALPSCADIINKWGGLLSNNKQGATLMKSPTEDLNLGVDYACR